MTDGGYTRLDDLEAARLRDGSTDRLEFVLEQLEAADELSDDLTWRTELWDSVTVEELLGALIEADGLLAMHREMADDAEYTPHLEPDTGGEKNE